MKIIETIDEYFDERGAAVTIGAFDGVHKGHQYLINKLIEIAKQKQLTTVIITFKRNPKSVFNTNSITAKRLLPLSKKNELLAKFGIDYLINLNFDENLFNMTAQDFVEKILFNKLNAKVLVVGDDFRFGRQKTGDLNFLRNAFSENLVIAERIRLNNEIISSTLIKSLIANYEFDKANAMLGYDYFFSGIVERGNNRGSALGFPTANIKYSENLIDINGVFATETVIENIKYKSISHIGHIPTFNMFNKIIETHILNFNKNIYGAEIFVSPKKFIRKIIKFNSIDELKKQIIIDIDNIVKE